MVFKYCLKIAPRLSGSPMGVPLVPATELRAEELLLATERWLALRTSRVLGRGF